MSQSNIAVIYRQLYQKRNSPMKNSKIFFSWILSLVLILSTFASTIVQDTVSLGAKADTVPAIAYESGEVFSALSNSNGTDEEDFTVSSRLLELIFGKGKTKQKGSLIKLCPGGDAFGVKIYGSGITVTKVVTELSSGLLKVDDKILSIDKKTVFSIDDVKQILNSSGGKTLSFEISRGGKNETVKIAPACAGGEYHLGVILSDGASGIGTVTYYDPITYEFGGLGHGICASDSSEVLKMSRGTVTGVILAGATRGESSKPGELRGVLTDKNLGSLSKNTKCGVFGKLDPSAIKNADENSAIPVAAKSEVHTGEATIFSTVKNGKRAEYKIEITDINYSSDGTKSFRIKVTDEALIALTGGIVRGMSGSPIIQDGKLVGAVTHVMVADPTEGYGIFIENMLNASQTDAQKAA